MTARGAAELRGTADGTTASTLRVPPQQLAGLGDLIGQCGNRLPDPRRHLWFVPQDVLDSGLLEGAQDVSTDPLRIEIWEEFKSSIGG